MTENITTSQESLSNFTTPTFGMLDACFNLAIELNRNFINYYKKKNIVCITPTHINDLVLPFMHNGRVTDKGTVVIFDHNNIISSLHNPLLQYDYKTSCNSSVNLDHLITTFSRLYNVGKIPGTRNALVFSPKKNNACSTQDFNIRLSYTYDESIKQATEDYIKKHTNSSTPKIDFGSNSTNETCSNRTSTSISPTAREIRAANWDKDVLISGVQKAFIDFLPTHVTFSYYAGGYGKEQYNYFHAVPQTISFISSMALTTISDYGFAYHKNTCINNDYSNYVCEYAYYAAPAAIIGSISLIALAFGGAPLFSATAISLVGFAVTASFSVTLDAADLNFKNGNNTLSNMLAIEKNSENLEPSLWKSFSKASLKSLTDFVLEKFHFCKYLIPQKNFGDITSQADKSHFITKHTLPKLKDALAHVSSAKKYINTEEAVKLSSLGNTPGLYQIISKTRDSLFDFAHNKFTANKTTSEQQQNKTSSEPHADKTTNHNQTNGDNANSGFKPYSQFFTTENATTSGQNSYMNEKNDHPEL